MFSKPAIRTYTFLTVLSALFSFSSLAHAADVTPWGVDFEKEGTPTFTLVCDGGHLVSKIYEGAVTGKDGTAYNYKYKGQTSTVADGKGGKKTFYLFARYLDTGLTGSAYLKEGEGPLRQLTIKEHMEMLMDASPNLYAKNTYQKNDCVATKPTASKK